MEGRFMHVGFLTPSNWGNRKEEQVGGSMKAAALSSCCGHNLYNKSLLIKSQLLTKVTVLSKKSQFLPGKAAASDGGQCRLKTAAATIYITLILEVVCHCTLG